MIVKIDSAEYKINIIKKNNKNTYIRIKGDTIEITTSKLVTNKQIKELVELNITKIKKMIHVSNTKQKKSEGFYYLGKKYDIITISIIKEVSIEENKIYTKSIEQLDKWLLKKTKEIMTIRMNEIQKIYTEKITQPTLKFRTMKTRWGVYNRKNHSVTLNTKLINHRTEVIDYVIIHELSHIIHFDHSKNFWELVNRNCQNYKMLRKELKEA